MLAKNFVKSIYRMIKDGVALALTPLEKALVKNLKNNINLIVIVGPARSGTTLVYQSIAKSFKVGYITNFVSWFNKTPVSASLLCHMLSSYKKGPSFSSYYGTGRGPTGINQGSAIWSRWFDKSNPRRLLDAKQKKDFRRTIRGLQKHCGKPLVIKWPGFSAHISPLLESMPEASVIRVRRKPYHVAKSVYKGRIELTGSPNISISREPDGSHQKPQKNAVESVCEYLYGIERELDRVLNELLEKEYFEVAYETLCKKPRSTMKEFHDWYFAQTQIDIDRRGQIPENFEASKGPTLNESEETGIHDKLDEIGILETEI